MISIRKTSKTYGMNTKIECIALNDINLDFNDSGLVFITGESGCGKSTLLNIISGLDSATEGEIYFNNQLISNDKFDEFRANETSVMFQKFNLIKDLNVEENLKIVGQIDGREISTDDINKKLAQIGLEGYNCRKINELSGGEEQRVAIVRALLRNPKILLADEPTGNLDVANSKIVLDIFKQLSETMLVVIVSHEAEYVELYADRIIALKDGSIVSDLYRNRDFRSEFYIDNNCGYISKHLSDNAVASINNSECDKYEFVSKSKFEVQNNELVPTDISQEYVAQKRKSKLSSNTLIKLSFSKLINHKIKFIAMMVAIFLAFSMFGVSFVFANYNVGEIAVSTLEDTGESGVMYSYGMEYPPFGYIDYSGYYINESTRKEITDIIGEDVDPYYMLTGSLSLNEEPLKNTQMSNSFYGFIETSADRLDIYGFDMLYGEYPENSDIKEDGYMSVAITDYTAYVIKEYGAKFDKNDFMIGLEPEEIVGKLINLGSETFYVSGIINTDFEEFIQYFGDEELSDDVASRYFSNLVLYYSVLYFADGASSELFSNYLLYSNSAMLSENFLNEAILGETMNGEDSNLKPPSIVWEDGKTSLGAKEMLVADSSFSNIFGEKFDKSHEEPYVYPLSVSFGNEVLFTVDFNVVGVVNDINLDYVPMSQIFVVNEADFDFVANDNQFLTGLFGSLPDGKDARISMINELVDIQGFIQSTYSQVVYRVYNEMQLYKTIFLYISLFLLMLVMLLIFDFFKNNIKDKQKDIGILMALGMKRATTAKILVMQVLFVSLISVVLIVIGIFALSAVMEVVLVSTLTQRLGTSLLASLSIITYSATPFLLAIGLSLLTIFISVICPIVKMMRNSPIDNIR